jgi:phosphatidylglycerophosphate synthase
MSADQWHVPDQPLRTSVLRTSVLGLLMVIAFAWITQSSLSLGQLYPVKVVTMFAVTMTIVFGLVGDHHPYLRFGPANNVTTVRAMLVTLMASLIGESAVPRIAAIATILAVVIAVLDGVDGWLARRSGMTSSFGARFDVETDALFVMAMSILVWQHSKAGVWVLLGGLRYIFVMAGWWLQWLARPLRPTWRAKTISVCHMVGLSVALAPFVHPPFSAMVMAVALLALSWSFAIDVRRLWRMP